MIDTDTLFELPALPLARPSDLEILRGTRHRLVEYGWRPYTGSLNGPACVGVAARGFLRDRCIDHEGFVLAYLAKLLDFPSMTHMYDWNDRQTSMAPVLQRLDEAITRVEQQENELGRIPAAGPEKDTLPV